MNEFLNRFHPWHKKYVQSLLSAYKADTLHHALIFSGAKYLGKTQFAEQLAKLLLCENAGTATEFACGQCKSCLLSNAATHPDLIHLFPPEGKKIIPVSLVRAAKEQLLQTAQMSGNKVCLIVPADAFNESSASALLKLLEEPPNKTYFILATDKYQEILPTIKSRCMRLAFGLPTSAELHEGLSAFYSVSEIDEAIKQQRGFPEKVLQSLSLTSDGSVHEESVRQFFNGQINPVQLAKQVEKGSVLEFLETLYQVVYMHLYAHTAQDKLVIQQVPELLAGLSNHQLLKLLNDIGTSRKHARLNPNAQLFLEALLFNCQRTLSKCE